MWLTKVSQSSDHRAFTWYKFPSVTLGVQWWKRYLVELPIHLPIAILYWQYKIYDKYKVIINAQIQPGGIISLYSNYQKDNNAQLHVKVLHSKSHSRKSTKALSVCSAAGSVTAILLHTCVIIV